VTKQIKAILGLAIAAGLFGGTILGQAARKSVSGAEVTGTFRYQFTGKFKGNYNEIKILALGKGKLRVSFDLTYPFVDGAGQMEANVGQIDGEANIEADTAMFTGGDNGDCRIRIKFVRAGMIKVDQQGESTGCGFGFNVSADGTYRKVSGAKPKFGQ
jgi:hypothetical protein